MTCRDDVLPNGPDPEREETAVDAQMQEGDGMAPVGRAFGIPDDERLSGLDHLACMATGSLEALQLPRPQDSSTTRVWAVRAIWDQEASVWVASSDDVPGLVTEAVSWDELNAKLVGLVPELLTLNGLIQADTGMLSAPSAGEASPSDPSHTIRCLVTTDPETGWLVGSVQDLAGVHTQGQTLTELKANLHEVLFMLKTYETVDIRKDIPHLNLQAGASGVEVHAYPKGVAYEVEFMTEDGRTLGVETFGAKELTPRRAQAIRGDADKHMTGAEVIRRQSLFGDFPAQMHLTCTQEVVGRYLAEVPELPGTMCDGSTQWEAMAKAQALALRVLAERLESGEYSATSFTFRL